MYRSAVCVMMALVLASVAVEGAAACSGSVLTLETLELAMGGSCHRCEEYLPHINTALQEAGMDCPLRIAAFLAEARHETAGFKYEVLVLWSGQEFWLLTRPLAFAWGCFLAMACLLAQINVPAHRQWSRGNSHDPHKLYDDGCACLVALHALLPLSLTRLLCQFELPAAMCRS